MMCPCPCRRINGPTSNHPTVPTACLPCRRLTYHYYYYYHVPRVRHATRGASPLAALRRAALRHSKNAHRSGVVIATAPRDERARAPQCRRARPDRPPRAPTALGQGHSRQGGGPSHRHTVQYVGNTRLGLYLGLSVSRF